MTCFPVIKRVSLASSAMSLLAAAVAVSTLFGSTTLAAPIAAEYFDYGPTILNLPGLGSSVDGWTGSWSNAGDLAMPDYGNTNLDLDAKYPAAQYDNSANVGGMAGKFQQVSPWYSTYRDFATPQTGTIWLSAILRYAADAGVNWDHVMLDLKQEASGGGADGVGIHDGHAFLMYRTWTDYDATGTPGAYSGTAVYLLLVKVEMNYSGTLDRITMWIDPNLSSGEAGLGAGTLMKEGQNALGSSLLGVGLSTGDQANEGLDAIRVGTTLADVTSASVVPDTTPPAAIEDLAVSASTATSITLRWTAPGDDDMTGAARTYDIRYATSAIDDSNWADATQVSGEPTPAVAGTVQSMTIAALTPGTTYYFAMKTADEVPNHSSLSNVLSGQTETDLIAPAAVDTLASSNATASSITLTWTAPGDDASTGTAASYDIRYGTVAIDDSNWAGATQVSGEPTPAAAGTVQAMTIPGLAPGTMYYFAMETADEVSNVSALSNIASAATLELGGTLQVTPGTVTFTGLAGTANPAPRDVTVENTGAATIHWTATVRAPAPAWLSLTNPAGTGDGSFTVNVNWQGLPVGTHTAYVDVADPQATNSPQTVTVVCDLSSAQQVVALKRDAGLTPGGGTDARFAAATVVTTTVSDTGIHAGGGYRWQNWGIATMPGMSHDLYKFSLSSIPAGSRINLAQLRVYHSSGNGTYGNAPIGMILTHDWIEGTRSGTYPGAAGGVSFAHPVGYNTGASQNASGGTTPPLQSWGPTSDSFFDLVGDVGPLKEPGSMAGYHVYDVTAHVQCWVNGALPNYGWAHYQGLWNFHMSEAGSALQPVLFIDYTVGGGSPDTTAPAAVADLGHSLATPSSLTITWSAPGDDAGTGTAYYYDLRYSTSQINEGNWAGATQIIGEPAPAAAGASQSYILENLTASTTYYFAIKTYDELWNASALSNIASATTPSGTPAPAAISNLTVGYATGTSVRLDWAAPGDDYNTGTAAAYDLRYSTSPITEANWSSATPYTYGVPAPAVAGTSQNVTVVYLNMLTTYYYAIKTVDGDGNWSPLSNVVSYRTLDDDLTAPSTVTNLAAGNPTANAVTLSWNASGDDAIFGTSACYDIRYSTAPITENDWFWTATKVTGEPTPLAYNTSQSMTVTGLNAGTTYYFAMRVVDEEMNWSGMAFVSATTLAGSDGTAPAAISTLVASHPSNGSVRLTWTATGDDGSSGTAATYDIRYSISPINEGNWAGASQAAGEPAPGVAGAIQTWTVQGLTQSLTWYFAIKAADEAGNWSALSNVVSSATLDLDELNKPVINEQDFEYLGAFKMPTSAGGQTTAFQSGGIAVRRVGGNLQILAEAGRLAWSRIYECTFPGWGQTSETWPQAMVIRDWGGAVYCSPRTTDTYLQGLTYDAATDRFYYSWGPEYNVSGSNPDSLGWAELIEGATVGHGPWHGNAAIANNHRIRGGSTMIPDWFASAFVGGRRLGLGFGGAYSGISSCSGGPYLAATMPPAADWPSAQNLDTIPLLDYPSDHWGTRNPDYFYGPITDPHLNPVDGVGKWTLVDEIDGAGVWIDLPDKHGVVFMPAMGHGHICYVPGGLHTERVEIHRLIYDPKDLAAVAQGSMQPWQPMAQDSIVPLTPHVNFNPLGGRSGIISGMAFDPQTRTLFAIIPPGYSTGGADYPLVHGWRLKETYYAGDINKDLHVDVVDLLYFVDAFGSVPGDANYDPACDFSGDDSVDVVDLLMLVESFGR